MFCCFLDFLSLIGTLRSFDHSDSRERDKNFLICRLQKVGLKTIALSFTLHLSPLCSQSMYVFFVRRPSFCAPVRGVCGVPS